MNVAARGDKVLLQDYENENLIGYGDERLDYFSVGTDNSLWALSPSSSSYDSSQLIRWNEST